MASCKTVAQVGGWEIDCGDGRRILFTGVEHSFRLEYQSVSELVFCIFARSAKRGIAACAAVKLKCPLYEHVLLS